jgi:hypothetical protein
MPMDLWNDIVTTALLGTGRRAFRPPPADRALAVALGQIDTADQAGALLAAAAVVALYQRAGQLPPRDDTQPTPACAPDQRLACAPRAARHLSAMLSDTQRALLPEWLVALEAAGRRVPNAQLPELLELGHSQAGLREHILPVLGRRGRWLAAQNPDWSYARLVAGGWGLEAGGREIGDSAETLKAQNAQLKAEWETGAHPARLTLLGELRKAAPAQARDLLATTWASEKAEHRSTFLATFAVGLTIDDEPFLEAALDDRSKEVRRCAAGLLAGLPESRLAQRMGERARPLLTWVAGEKRRLLGLRPGQSARIEIVLPADCDKAMIRDGIEPKPPAGRQKLGEKAWWLLQILRAIPPGTWCQQWSATPAELMTIAEQSEWRAVLQEGWVAAALAARDTLWAEEMLRVDPNKVDLLDLLSPARQEALLLQILRSDCMPLHKHAVLGLLRQTRHTWSAALTRAVMQAIHRHMRKWKDPYDYQLRSAITEDFARRIPPALLDEIAAGWPNDPAVRERWEGVIDRMLITLQFRRDMLDALSSEL